MESNCIYLQGDNIIEERRREIFSFFSKFGKIQKLFLSANTSKVYYESEEVTLNTYASLQQYDLDFQVALKPDLSSTSKMAVPSSPNNRNSNSEYGPLVKDIHGSFVTTMMDSAGELYIPMKVAKSKGLFFYDVNHTHDNNKFPYNKEDMEEFNSYMTLKAKKFLQIRRGLLHPEINPNLVADNAAQFAFNPKSTPARVVEIQTNNIKITSLNSPPKNKHFSTGNTQVDEIVPHQRHSRNSTSELNKTYPINNVHTSNNLSRYEPNLRNQNYSHAQSGEQSFNQHSQPRLRNRSQSASRSRENYEKAEHYSQNRNLQEKTVLGQDTGNNYKSLLRGSRDHAVNPEKKFNCNKKVVANKDQGENTTVVAETSNDLMNNGNFATLPSEIKLELNACQKVCVVHTETKTTGWVQLMKNEIIINKLNVNVQNEVKAHKKVSPVCGKIYAAAFKNWWYRAKVLSVHPEIKVQFIDYGNVDKCNEVLELSSELCSIDRQAIQISLDDPNGFLNTEDEIDIKPIKLQNGIYIVELEKKLKNETPSVQLKEEVPKAIYPKSNRTSLCNSDSISNSSSRLSQTLDFKKEVPKTIYPKYDNPTDEVKPAKRQSQTLDFKKEVSKTSSSKNDVGVHHNAASLPQVVDRTITKSCTKITRKSAAEITQTGVISCVNFLSDDTFVAFIVTTELTEEFEYLDRVEEFIKEDASFKATVGDLVAVLNSDNVWTRGIVFKINNDKYQLALIDFGSVMESDKIHRLDDKILGIPEFSCVCSVDSTDIATIKNFKNEMIPYVVEKPGRFILASKIKASVCQWTCFYPKEKQVLFKNIPSEYPINAGDPSIIIDRRGKFLLIRTRSSTEHLQTIKTLIQSTEFSALEDLPTVDQMVLSPKGDTPELFRAIVRRIDGDSVEVDFIDCGIISTAPIKTMKNVTETVAEFKCAAIKICLKGFTDESLFDSKISQALNAYIQGKQKFTLHACDNGEYDLLTINGEMLSAELIALNKPTSTKIFFKEVPVMKLQIGLNQMVCTCAEVLDTGLLTFCPANEEIGKILVEITNKINDFISRKPIPYYPERHEVCLALFEGDWFRATVMQTRGNDIDVYYIDYGNSRTVTVNEIRKLPIELGKLPLLAAVCSLKGFEKIKGNDKLITKLRNYTLEQNLSVNVFSYNGSEYLISIPSVYEQLQLNV